MSEPIVSLKKRTPLVSLSRERFVALQAEVKLLREVVKAFECADIYKAGEIHEPIRTARAALESFDKKGK
jgi:hypothetical protein